MSTEPLVVGATLAAAGMDVVPAIAAQRYPVGRDGEAAWRDADRILLSTEPFAFRERDRRDLEAATGMPVALVDGEWTSWYGARAAPGLRALTQWRLATTQQSRPP